MLQENVIFTGFVEERAARLRSQPRLVRDTGLTERIIDPAELILPSDPECVLHVVPDETDARIAEQMRGLPHRLADLGVSVSTGRVVGFRAKERLHVEAKAKDVPLIFSRHFTDGFVSWPKASGIKTERFGRDWS